MKSEVLTGNEWVGRTYQISGGWSIRRLPEEGFALELAEDFATLPGPDLKVYATRKHMSDIGNRESVDHDGLYVAELLAPRGAQAYPLPAEYSPDEYPTIAIHCRAYSVVWGGFTIDTR